MSSIEAFKNQFAKNPNLHHFNNAGLAPITRVAKEKVQYWADRFYQEGFWTDSDYMDDVKQTRVQLSQMIGCQAHNLAFFPNTSFGISQVAFNFPLKQNDEVLMWDQEYSSHLYPWQEACKRSKAHLKLVESNKDLSLDTNKIIEAITENTKVLAFSWYQFQTGAGFDYQSVIKICKQKDIFVFVDVMQGLGLFACDLWELGVDAISGGSHKWLVSPVGVGFLAIRDEHAIKFKPLSYGAYTFGTCDDPADLFCAPKKDASRFESGSKQVLEITALGASVTLINNIGPSKIHQGAIRVANDLKDKLHHIGCKVYSPSGEHLNHPIVNWTGPQNMSQEKTIVALKAANINFAIRGPGLRFSPQAFNTIEEVDLIIETIKNSFL